MSKKSENNKISDDAIMALDTLLGLALVLIIFDYSRDFLSSAEFYPTDLGKTNFGVFMSRWLTYFGAPILMLVSGMHIGFKKLSGWDRRSLSNYLLKRGVFLVVLDLVLVSFGFNFSFSYAPYVMMLGSLGISFIVLSAFVYLPATLSIAFGLLIIFLHDLLPVFSSKHGSLSSPLGVLIHGRGTVIIFDQMLFVVYSLLPWLGVVLLGYGLAQVFVMDANKRKSLFMKIGLAATLGFIVLRTINDYGDPDYWWVHDEQFFTFLSFVNVNKFPASLLYLLMTLGPIFMLLSVLEGRSKPFLRRLAMFGKVPLLFYIIGLYLIHTLSVLAGSIQGFQPVSFIAPVWKFPDGFGYDLLPIILFTMGLVVVLYPLCRWIDGVLGERMPTAETYKTIQSWTERLKVELRNF